MRVVRGHLVPNPGLGALEGLRREMQRAMEETSREEAPRSLSSWSCPAEVVESGEEIRFAVELPGVRPDDVELTVENRIMSISGEKRLSRDESEADEYRLNERCYGHFERSFVLPESANTDGIEAGFDSGVLNVVVPKRAESRARRIQIGS